MKETKIIITVLMWAATMVSCHQTGHDYYYHELEKIDHRQNRELARREVAAISAEIARQSEDLRMYHLLLVAEMSEEVKPYRNIDTARKLIEYYEERGKVERGKLLRSYIVAGTIYANCSDSPKALGYFHKAEDMLAEYYEEGGRRKEERELRNKLYGKIARLQLRHNMPEAARIHANQVFDYCRQQNDTAGMMEALLFISATYHNLPGEIDYLQRADKLAKEFGRDTLQNAIQLALATYFVERGHCITAKPLAAPLRDRLPASEQQRLNALLCRIYYHTGQLDSACYYGEKVMKNGNSVSRRDVHRVLAYIGILRGQRDDAVRHLDQYIELDDELKHIANSEAIAQADAFYHNQKQEQENEKLRAENDRKHHIIIIGVALFVVLTALFATYIHRHRRRQELMEMRIEHLEQLKRDYAKADVEMLRQAVETIESTTIWQRLATLPDSDRPKDEDWQELAEAVNQTYEGFSTRLMRLCHPTLHEYHVCLLLKAGFEPVRIATLTFRSKAAISTVRSRLYEKTFGRKGSAKDWDEVIRTL